MPDDRWSFRDRRNLEQVKPGEYTHMLYYIIWNTGGKTLSQLYRLSETLFQIAYQRPWLSSEKEKPLLIG